MQIDLSGHERMKSVAEYLRNSDWHLCILHDRGITAMEAINKSSEARMTVISFHGSLAMSKNDLGFESQKSRRSKKFAVKSSKILNVQRVPFSGEELIEIEDGNVNYFLVQNSIYNRQINLMRPDLLK